jgi:acyl-CoA thioester hydrolase
VHALPVFVLQRRAVETAPSFRLSFEVKAEDIDELEHASNIAYVRWIQDVAIAHSQAVGFGVRSYLVQGAVFVVVRHEIDYLRPVLRGDTILARTWISSVMAAKCIRSTELTEVKSGALVAKSQTTWGFIDMATGRPRRIPEEVKEAFFKDLDA